MKKWILTALAVAGAAMCMLLANMTAPGTGEAIVANWCAPTEHMDCGYVLSSSYARIGDVVGVAQLGIAYFAFLAAWFAIVGIPNFAGRAWRIVPLGITALGALTSAWFIYVMAARLPVWCPWCVAVHVVNGLLFILVLAFRPKHMTVASADGSTTTTTIAPYPSATRALGVIGGAMAFAGMLIIWSFALFHQAAANINKNRLLEILTDVDYCEWDWRRQPVVDLAVRPDDPVIGSANAPMTAVAFIDFECPHCRDLHHFAMQMQTAFPRRVRFIFKHLPMNAACNPNQRSLHRYACEAALAAEAARSVSNEETAAQFRGLLFDNMPQLASRPYRELAAKAGIAVDAFEKALAQKVGRDRVAEDVALAGRVGITGSGKMFLQGRRLDHWMIPSRVSRERNDRPRTSELWRRLLGLPASMPATQPAD